MMEMLKALVVLFLVCTSSAQATHVSVFFVGGQSNATQQYKDAIQAALIASGRYEEVLVAYVNHSGSSISLWMTNPNYLFYENDFFNSSGTGVLQSAIASISPSKTYSFEGLFWFQGEADRFDPPNWVSLFKDAPNSLLSRLRADLGSSNWKYVVTLVDSYTTNPSDKAMYDAIHDAMKAMVDNDPAYGLAADSRGYERRSDRLHLVVPAVATQFGTDSVGIWFNTLPMPGVPMALQATNLQATLTWNAATNARGYNVKRSMVRGGPYVMVDNTPNTNFIDTTAVSGVTNYYVVVAANAAGQTNSAEVAVVPRPNLAFNQPVAVSSGTNAGSAVDGSFATRWSSDYSDPQWISVDLGAICRVDTIRLQWETAYAKSYQIQFSTNNVSWTTNYSTTTGAGGVEILTLTSAPARYVRMYGTQRGTTYGYSLWEFEVYGNWPTNLPSAPGGLNASTISSNQINLTWSASTNATTYSLKRATTSGGPYTVISTLSGTNFSNTSLPSRTTYYYVVSALNATSESIDSTEACATTRSSATGIFATTGASLDLSLPSTWTSGILPLAGDIANFTVAGLYTNSATPLSLLGMTVGIASVEIKPIKALTLNLGNSGITGSQSLGRLGNTDGYLTVAVGANNQSWARAGGNIGAKVTGTATIALDGPSQSYWFRGDNSGFTGIWNLASGNTFQAAGSTSFGGTGVRLIMAGNSTLRFGGNGTTSPAISLAGSANTFIVSSAVAYTVNGSVSGGALDTPNTLTLDPWSSGASSLTFNGSLAGHVGYLIINKGNSGGFTCNLNTNFSCIVGANHIVDGVDTTSQGLIRAGTGIGLVNLNLNGSFVIDLSGAATANGNSWKLVDTANLNVTYGATFAVNGFTEATPGVWTKLDSGRTWSFTEASGILGLAVTLPTTPTNLLWHVTGTNLNLSWPSNYIGWILQTQTNPLNTGLFTNWGDVPASVSNSQWSVPIGSMGAGFYRLRAP